MKKVGLSGWEALAVVRRELNTHCVGRVSLASEGLEKVRLSGQECSHWRPLGDQYSRCWTGKDRKGEVVWKGGSRWHSTGDKYSHFGWLILAGHRIEKVSLSGWGGSSQRPSGEQYSLCRTGKHRQAWDFKR